MPDSQQNHIERARDLLIEQALEFLGTRSTGDVARFRQLVEKLIAETPKDELARVVGRVHTTGNDWGYHPREEFARRVHYAMADLALAPGSVLEGTEHILSIRDRPLIFLLNHLSYADANLFEVLLHRNGFDDVGERLTVIAGPKVYAEAFRRFSSMCFGTIKTPQSSSRSTGEAVMTQREVARVARETINLAIARHRAGDALLIFVEGTRSRTAEMQPALAAVSRYFDEDASWLVPVAVSGSEHLVPVGEERVHPTRVTVRLGAPFNAARLRERCDGKRQLMVDVVGLEIARLLPPRYQGAYGDGAEGLEEARRVAGSLAAR